MILQVPPYRTIFHSFYLQFFYFSFDHPNVIEGQGTVGIEIMEQLPTVDAVLVPCGGGSLLAGVAIAVKHLKPDTEVYVSLHLRKKTASISILFFFISYGID